GSPAPTHLRVKHTADSTVDKGDYRTRRHSGADSKVRTMSPPTSTPARPSRTANTSARWNNGTVTHRFHNSGSSCASTSEVFDSPASASPINDCSCPSAQYAAALARTVAGVSEPAPQPNLDARTVAASGPDSCGTTAISTV